MRDGHFSPAGIDCSHTCLVLFSTHTAHIRAVGTHLIQRTLDTLLVYTDTHTTQLCFMLLTYIATVGSYNDVSQLDPRILQRERYAHLRKYNS